MFYRSNEAIELQELPTNKTQADHPPGLEALVSFPRDAPRPSTDSLGSEQLEGAVGGTQNASSTIGELMIHSN